MKKTGRKKKDSAPLTANRELHGDFGVTLARPETRSGDSAPMVKVTLRCQAPEEERQWNNAFDLFLDAMVREYFEGRRP